MKTSPTLFGNNSNTNNMFGLTYLSLPTKWLFSLVVGAQISRPNAQLLWLLRS